MKSVIEIVNNKGGLELLPIAPVRVEVEGFMRLVIEYVGTGLRGGSLVSVAHYYEQAGDLVTDPEVVFEVVRDQWSPVSFEMGGQLYQEIVFLGDDGRVMVRPKWLKDTLSFCRMWNRNLRDQGFVKASKSR